MCDEGTTDLQGFLLEHSSTSILFYHLKGKIIISLSSQGGTLVDNRKVSFSTIQYICTMLR